MLVAVVLVCWLAAQVGVRVWASRMTIPPPVPAATQERVRVLVADGERRRAQRVLRRELPTRALEAAAAVRHLERGDGLFVSWEEMAADLDPVVARRVRALAAAGDRTAALRAVRRATGLSPTGSVRLVDALTG